MALLIGGSITWLLVQALVCLTGVQTVLSTNMKYKIRANCKIKDGCSMEEYTAGSLISCIKRCTTRPGCISVGWNLQTDVCTLSAYDTISEEIIQWGGYEQAAHWTCASLVRFPVYRALNSTYATQRYEMLFPRASARCTELGTTLADSSILTTAQQNLGLQFCNCGWMANGENALVLNYEQPGCSGPKGVVICGLHTADAWCLMP